MKNRNKKTLYTIISLSILIILVIILFGTKQYMMKDADWKFYSIERTDYVNYYSYSLTTKTINPVTFNNAPCDTKSEVNIDEKITWYDGKDNYQESGQGIDVEVLSDTQLSKYFPVTEVKINNIYGAYRPCTGFTDRGQININTANLTAACSADDVNSITCQIKGIAYSPEGKDFSLMGQPEILLTTKILKNGIDCLDNSYCTDNKTCDILNQCTIKEIPCPLCSKHLFATSYTALTNCECLYSYDWITIILCSITILLLLVFIVFLIKKYRR